MEYGSETTELRRGVIGPCVLALLAERPRFGLELVRDLSHADGLLTSEGTVYPLLNRLRDAGWVTSRWKHEDDQRPRRYYSITAQGRDHLAAFRAEWSAFAAAVDTVLAVDRGQPRRRQLSRQAARSSPGMHCVRRRRCSVPADAIISRLADPCLR